jgi:hypothetical protein
MRSQRAHFDTPPNEGGYSVRAVGHVFSKHFTAHPE